MLLLGKKIIEETFGNDHEDSIDTCQCIANSYGAMERYIYTLFSLDQLSNIIRLYKSCVIMFS